jgi:cellulose synthase (UDP-forming)
MGKEFYFKKFEDRKPYPTIRDSKVRTFFFQMCGIITIALGFSYLYWRWRYSLNPHALWFGIPLVSAETLSFFGTILVVFSFWSFRDPPKAPPIHYLSELEDLEGRPDRPIRIDVFIATYNEDVELVRYSIIDAKKMAYPFPDVKISVFVLDDGRRDGRDPGKENMKAVAEEEGVGYLIREHNEGYKAGNLKNALEQTDGDLFVILDADTRPYPSLLQNTTGYFRRRKVAWVQTPQWFYDTTAPEKLSDVIATKFNVRNRVALKTLGLLFGRIQVNEDIFGNDGRLFYDVILRKRNFYNAAFCCGAGSVHRREAVMTKAVKDFAAEIRKLEKELQQKQEDWNSIRTATEALLLQKQVIPFKFHASEDIYTSITLHADKENRWESIEHPDVECRMLSTQDLDAWIKQHQRYAEGSLDIAFKENPLFNKGLTWGQRLCYFSTVWSYFAPLWILVFLVSPIIYFFTLAMPVQTYSFDFFKHFLPFQVMNTITITLGCWGIPTRRGEQYYISGFWYNLLALVAIIRGKKVKFHVTPKERTAGRHLQHILPHIIIISLSILGILYNVVLIALHKHPSLSAFAANTFWCLFSMMDLSIMIRAAHYTPAENRT